ncbi:MAG: class I SAM-dependent methyltransferase [Microcystis sp.]|jgi:hypothetical protein|uniref:class I SAM-dependent methyltransferase n=2 Tax=Microcystaceae TaxID=1890449 RepID=UPI000CACB072|nr:MULTISPECIES: hypothetical protein [Microcystis]MCZ8163194.1 hypothetical protein [Microcystis sp. LE19-196.1B]MCZ8272820.1 hypothetical protein [Microcystis sp. LE19-4.1E]GBE74429.1 hypothetical protein myaer87_16560 [Microcystis aeruginosa NIES-87]MCA2716830.1 hypothetical protein [Microcystis sp. M169S2]MCZ8067655.1 hypothetical protein [Microcystis sp. LE17-20D]
MKLNIGCGTDYREGFVNIDGSKNLPKIDQVIDISAESLLTYFNPGTIEYILANDIIEHHFHWEAVRLLTEFFTLLKTDGIVEIRVPDIEYIIKSWRFWRSPIEKKIVMLYGGQDLPQGNDIAMNESRKKFPQFFCHKYGYSMQSMKQELEKIGFRSIKSKRAGTNFVTYAIK